MSQSLTTVNVAGAAYAAQASPDVSLNFEPKHWVIVNEHATGDVFGSFDGINDHFHLTPMSAAASVGSRIEFYSTYSKKLWLRFGAAAATPVRVTAES
jgi:hypothetical protein